MSQVEETTQSFGGHKQQEGCKEQAARTGNVIGGAPRKKRCRAPFFKNGRISSCASLTLQMPAVVTASQLMCSKGLRQGMASGETVKVEVLS